MTRLILHQLKASGIYPHGQHQGVFPLQMMHQDPMSLYHGLGSLENTSPLLTLFRMLLKRIVITICPVLLFRAQTRSRHCTGCYWKGYSRSILRLRPCIRRRAHLGRLPRPMIIIITNSVCPRTPYWGFILPHSSTRRAHSLHMRSRRSRVHGDSLPCGNSCLTYMLLLGTRRGHQHGLLRSHSRIRFCGHQILATAFQRLLRLTLGMDLAPLHRTYPRRGATAEFRLLPTPVTCRWMSRSPRRLSPPSCTLPRAATEQTVPTATSCPSWGAEESGYPKRGPGRSLYML
ncbi:hypothetical protein JB92DRAFT_2970250 [Gautieria morchelliformis]|nr:hypothetical protein JB92DRAFT_2970250 [Gautieria morchelliformis]